MTFRSLIIASILIAANGCSQSSDRDLPADQKAMLGSWKRLYAIDGWTGDTAYHPADDEHVTIFERDSTYSIMINGRTEEDGRYTVSHSYGILRISYHEPNRSEYYATIFGRVWVENDTLHISGRETDGPEYVYLRL